VSTITPQAPAKGEGRGPRPPIDPRFRARRVEVRRTAGRRRLRRLAIAGAVLGVVVLAGLLTLTPALDVDHVRVEGEYRTPADQVVDTGGIGRGSPMVLADLDAAARRVEALPWVASVEITRSWPGTIRYEIDEREPAAVVAAGEDRWLAADAEGRVVAELEHRPLDLPLVEGTETGTEPGAVTAEADQEAFRVAAALPPSVRRIVSTVSWDGETATIHLTAGGTATVGDGEDLEDKAVALASVLAARDPACVAHLDVSLPAAPVLTGLPGCG
jgi:cell division protein FtsQ